jgi:hypothetical protein
MRNHYVLALKTVTANVAETLVNYRQSVRLIPASQSCRIENSVSRGKRNFYFQKNSEWSTAMVLGKEHNLAAYFLHFLRCFFFIVSVYSPFSSTTPEIGMGQRD